MILVTGGAGFIGSNFIRFVLDKYGENIINLDALTYAGNKGNLPSNHKHLFFKTDIRDYEQVVNYVKLQPRVIVHFAAESHVDNSIEGPRVFVDTNVIGTFNLLEAVRQHSPDTLFIHVSTDEVFGSLGFDDPAFTENHPYKPNSPYSASKAASDHLVRSYHETYGLMTIITNCSNNYGPYQHKEKLIPKVIERALLNQPIPVYGDGMNRRDWIHVDDHCAAIDYLISKGTPGETYNIGTMCEVANIDMVTHICNRLDLFVPQEKKYETNITFVKDRLGHDLRYAIDNSKLVNLGWKPTIQFNQGLDEVIKFYIGQ
jgi:dTDP-glucose 4,6-dehydratase